MTFAGPTDLGKVLHVVPDSAGNTYAGGFFHSPTITFGNYVLTNNGSYDSFVVKFDAEFNPVWARGSTFTRSNTFLSGLVINTNGQCYVAHSGYNLGSSGQTDFRTTIVKYNQQGEPVWTNRINDIKGNGNSLALDGANNCYFTGTQPDRSFVLVKINPQGSQEWLRVGGPIAAQNGHSIAVDRNGNSIVTAAMDTPTTFFGTTTLTNRGIRDIVLVRYDTTGNLLWAGRPGGSDDDVGTDVAMDSAGNSYVTGWITSTNAVFGNKSYQRSSASGLTLFVAKLNAAGSVEWAKQIAEAWQIYPLLLVSADQHTNIYVTGWVDIGGYVRTSRFSSPDSATFIIKCSPIGDVVGGKLISSSRDSYFRSRVAFPSPHEIYVGGEFSSNDAAEFAPMNLPEGHWGSPFIAALGYNPRLHAILQGNSLTVRWPTNEPGFVLETSGYLSTNGWTEVTNLPVIVGSEHRVTNELSDSLQLFRLRK